MKKSSLIFLLLIAINGLARAQKKINDESIRYQQERMVFKQWDQNKFKPSPGFLGLNPLYWLTWAWHRDYHKHDLRPLSPLGPQTLRLALAAGLQNTEQAYKLQTDTLRNMALTQVTAYSGLVSDADPLWLLYYRHQFQPLLYQNDARLLDGLAQQEKDYVIRSKLLDWYLQESHALAERLNAARTTTLERGARIITYQRLLDEYRILQAGWEAKKQTARQFIELSESSDKLKKRHISLSASQVTRSDVQIATDILSHSKL
ncbi:hypothetical protein SNE25_09595 [Mucilaginibacter sabulilitoris]|uniref:TolC family protein n=1 Tax=Mucilaginibacter sabulilitoris TaxID=1173583 RepID=A0ABZ0TRL8_9SPHI|nr:hypothetical protein [Mucilaginibacter sabulilitoris]WPU95771.1 hypothetical protein SNE25_09595 [Mucilaginibacter sabulilitoris]